MGPPGQDRQPRGGRPPSAVKRHFGRQAGFTLDVSQGIAVINGGTRRYGQVTEPCRGSGTVNLNCITGRVSVSCLAEGA